MLIIKKNMRLEILNNISENSDLSNRYFNSTNKQVFVYGLIEEYERKILGDQEKLSVLDKLTIDLVKYKSNNHIKKDKIEKDKKKIIPYDLSNNPNYDE